MTLRCGITTGTCAAAAAKAAAMVVGGAEAPRAVDLRLPSGQTLRVPILHAEALPDEEAARASVRKDAGDDPDVTDGMEVRALVRWDERPDVTFLAGEGVGTVTKPGLQIPPGQPAINPAPRQMIAAAIREITPRGVCVEVAIPGGRAVAAKTFNPRLGIEGGLSILGTTGIVRPYCVAALHDALKCSLDVAQACGVSAPVFVAGNIGARAAGLHFTLRPEQVIEAGNEWGFVLDQLAAHAFEAVLILGHPGKLAKLSAGDWDTHSARSRPAVEIVRSLCAECLGHAAPESPTAEGLFSALPPPEKRGLADALAQRIRAAVRARIEARLPVAVFLVDMAGQCLGTDGDLAPWR